MSTLLQKIKSHEATSPWSARLRRDCRWSSRRDRRLHVIALRQDVEKVKMLAAGKSYIGRHLRRAAWRRLVNAARSARRTIPTRSPRPTSSSSACRRRSTRRRTPTTLHHAAADDIVPRLHKTRWSS